MKTLAVRAAALSAGVAVSLAMIVSTATSAGARTQGSPDLAEVELVIEPAAVEVVLGEAFDLTILVTNNGAAATPNMVVHVDITDPGGEGSVDPEDWTSTLTKRVGVLEAGQTATVDWELQPIAGGRFSVYAVGLSPDVTTVVSSDAVTIDVEDKRSLNPDGILPVAVGAPVLIGGLLLTQMRLARRQQADTSPHGLDGS